MAMRMEVLFSGRGSWAEMLAVLARSDSDGALEAVTHRLDSAEAAIASDAG
jgi:hypothetical protein